MNNIIDYRVEKFGHFCLISFLIEVDKFDLLLRFPYIGVIRWLRIEELVARYLSGKRKLPLLENRYSTKIDVSDFTEKTFLKTKRNLKTI